MGSLLQGISLRHAYCSVLRILGSFLSLGYILGKSDCHGGLYDIEEKLVYAQPICAQQINYRSRRGPIRYFTK